IDASSLIEELETQKERAEKLVGVIGMTGMAGAYREVANEARRRANRWQRTAVVGIVGLILFTIGAVVPTFVGSIDLQLFLARATVAGGFGLLVAYAARQAERSERVEQWNRKYELELASLNPFLADLPEEKKVQIKESLSSKMFGQPLEPMKDTSGTTGTPMDII